MKSKKRLLAIIIGVVAVATVAFLFWFFERSDSSSDKVKALSVHLFLPGDGMKVRQPSPSRASYTALLPELDEIS
jgi:flagellar biosynthesis/type III secretory pathway M-ring protein FliF/YscJ